MKRVTEVTAGSPVTSVTSQQGCMEEVMGIATKIIAQC